MFGVSYFNLSIHFGLNIILAVLSIFILGCDNNTILFFSLFIVAIHSLITDLLPHRTQGVKRILHIVLEEQLPCVLVLLVLCLLSKNSVPWKGVLISVLVISFVSLFLKGLFSFIYSWLNLKITQLIVGTVALIFLCGIFLLPTLLVVLTSYESKNEIYLFFAQVNPLIVISFLFGIDPFHKDQLYHYFGSSFLVPKMDGYYSLLLIGIFAALFWMLYGFWGKERKEEKIEFEINNEEQIIDS